MIDSHDRRRSERNEKKGKSQAFDKERFTSSLTLLESERHSLLQGLREMERKLESEIDKNAELGRNLSFQDEHIRQIESEKAGVNEKLRSLQRKLEEFEELHSNLLQERNGLKSTISKLQDEIDLHKQRSGDRDLYIGKLTNSYNDEKETIVNVHSRHSKLLTSKIIFDTVSMLTAKRKSWTFAALRFKTREKLATAKICLATLARYISHRTHHAFTAIKNAVQQQKLDKMHKNFIDKIFLKKSKKRVWERILQYSKIWKKYREKVAKGMGKTWKVEMVRKRLRVFRMVQRWKNVKIKDLYGKRILWGVLKLRYRWALGLRFEKWKGINKRVKDMQGKEDLAAELTGFTMKQAVFYELKRLSQLNRAKRVFEGRLDYLRAQKNKFRVFVELQRFKSSQDQRFCRIKHISAHLSIKSAQKAFNDWNAKVLKHKTIKKITRVFLTNGKRSDKITVGKIFIAWKLHFCNEKYKKASTELDIERPRRQEIEAAYKSLHSSNQRILMSKAIVNVMKSIKIQLKGYFMLWQSRMYEYESGKVRISRLFVRMYSNSLEARFKKWKKYVENLDVTEIIKKNTEVLQENYVLLDHISKLETCLDDNLKEKSLVILINMQKALSLIHRKEKISNLRRWAQNAFKKSNIILSCFKMNSLITQNVTNFGLSCLIINTQKAAEKSSRNRKLYIYTFKKWSRVNFILFQAWCTYKKLCQAHRSQLSKILIKKYRNTSAASFDSWKNTTISMRNLDAALRFEVLDNDYNQIKEELEDACNNLSIQLDNKWKTEQFIKATLLKKGLSALIRINGDSLKKSFNLWINFIGTKELIAKYIKKIMSFTSKGYYRKVFKIWGFYKNGVIRMSNSNSVNTLVLEKKIIRREMNQLEKQLKEVITQKEEEIKYTSNEKNTLCRRVENLLQISVRRNNDNIVVTKSEWAFKLWKESFLKRKSGLNNVFSTIQKWKVRRSFKYIKNFSKMILNQRYTTRLIIELILNFKSRKLKHSLHYWRSNHFKLLEKSKNGEILLALSRLKALNIKHQSSKKNSIFKALTYINNRKKLKIISAWKNTANQLNLIKQAKITYSSISDKLKSETCVGILMRNSCISIRNKAIYQQVYNARLHGLLNCTFYSWKSIHYSCRYLANSLRKVIQRSDFYYLAYSFSQIKAMGVYQSTTQAWRFYSKQSQLKTITSIMDKSRIFQCFKSWHLKVKLISTIITKLQIILASTSTRLRSKSFVKWSYYCSIQFAIENTELAGKSARKAKKQQRLLRYYRSFLKKEGLSLGYLDDYLLERLPPKLILKQKSQSSDPLYKFFFLWRSFLIKRKKYRKCASRILAYKRKGSLLQGFTHWKIQCPSYSTSLKLLNRRELISNLVSIDSNMNRLKDNLKEKHLSLRYLENYTEILEEHMRRGQNQALANLAAGIKIAQQKALVRWFINIQAIRMYEIDIRLRDVEDELVYYRRKCKDFDIENKELVIENKGLIKASYESREYLNNIKALSLEKARLEDENAEKKETIRRLVQENRELAIELSGLRYN